MPIPIVKGEIANALTSIAPNHILGVTHDIYDEDMQKYQSDVNQESVDATALGYPTFSVTDSYAVGDIVFYIRKLYKFTSTHVAGAWNSSHVEEYSISDAIASGIYDVTANNEGATFASLSALLSDENLNTLIPTSVRNGGMTIRFVQSSDNKYVQYRYMGTAVTGTPNPFLDTANWQGVDDEPTAGSDNFVKSSGVFKAIEKGAVVSSQDTAEADLMFSDEDGNVLVQFKDGHIKTKKFDSSNIVDLVGKKITDGEMDEVLGGDVAVYLTDADGKAVLDDEGKPIEII